MFSDIAVLKIDEPQYHFLQCYVTECRWNKLVNLYGKITHHKRPLSRDEISAITTALLKGEVVYKGFASITKLLLSHPGIL